MVCFHQHRINDSTVLSSSDSRKNKSIAVAVVGSITVYILAWSESRFIQGIAKLRKMCSQVLVISVLYCLECFYKRIMPYCLLSFMVMVGLLSLSFM